MKLKKALSFILCALLVASLAPAAVFAANGANPQSRGGVWASVTLTGAADKVLFSGDGAVESQILAPNELTEPRYCPVEGAFYDVGSNTLTLSNFAGEGVVLNLTMMGADFRLRLVGSSTLTAIRSESLGYGGSICVCGDGSLTVTNPDGTAICIDADGAADCLRVEAQARLTASSSVGGAVRVVNSALGTGAIQFDTATPDVAVWDSSAPLTDRYTSDGALIDVCTLAGSDGLFGLEATIDEASESLVYNLYRLNGTDAYGDYLAELVETGVTDLSPYSPAFSAHDVSLYENGADDPAPRIRFARFSLNAYGSDEKGSVSITPAAVGRGGSATVSVRPAEGCKLKSLTINGTPVQPVDGLYTIGFVTGDINAEAVFSEAAPAAIRVDAPALTDYTVPADGAADFFSAPFTATVTDGGGDAVGITIDWSISPHTGGVSIGSDGRVRIANEAKSAMSEPIRYTVTAAAEGTELVDSTKSFTVSRMAHAPYAVKLMRANLPLEDEDTVLIPAAGGTTVAEYRGVVLDPYGEVVDSAVVWSAGDWPLGVRREGNTVYVADNCAAGSTLSLMAAAESDGTAAAMLTIRFAAAPEPTPEPTSEPTPEPTPEPTVISGESDPQIDSVPAASAKALTDEMVTLAAARLPYTGTAQTPAVTVRDGETTLTENTDYTLNYADNVEIGTATVTVTGSGTAYTGTVSKQFRIVALEVSWPSVSEADGKVYGAALEEIVSLSGGSATADGETVEGGFSVKNGESVPDVGGKYRLVFRSTDGDLTKESGEYTLTKLQPKPITAEMITVSPAEIAYDYGEELKPAVIVRDGSRTLEKDLDYTLGAYSNNTAIGTGSVAVMGTGNYGGSAAGSFTITPIPAEALASGVLITPCRPEDAGITPALTIRHGEHTLTDGTDYDVVYSYDVDKKTGTASIVFKGTYSGSLAKDFNLPNYLIVEGAGGSWSKSTTVNLRFAANGALGKFTGLTVDGKKVDAKYYSTESGGTIVKIKADYLKGLTAGKHIVGVLYPDGKALAIFSVTGVDRRGVPTGDGNNAAVWVALMAASLIALGTLGWLFFRDRRGKKKKKKKR